LSLSCLDAVAAGLPLGIAVTRIGDVINGEEFGRRPTSSSASAIRARKR
jgi:prolipoprotein diacylglyceryltransferase